MKKITDGLLIILEGPEGVGKTTQAKNIVDYYNKSGYDALYLREPGSSTVAETIRSLVLDNDLDSTSELLLYEAARLMNVRENILPALNDGKIVVIDRFTLSTIVYQTYIGDADYSLASDLNRMVTKAIFDGDGYAIEFLLLCDPKVAMERALNDGREINKNDTKPLEFHENLYNAYENAFEYHDIKALKRGIVTTKANPDTITDRIVYIINNVIQSDAVSIYED